MELEKKEQDLVNTIIKHWEQEHLLQPGQGEKLRASLTTKKPAGQIAQYFFIISIACTLLAFGAIFIDDKLLEKIKVYFDIGNIAIAVSCTAIAIAWFGYLWRKRKGFTSLAFEIYMVLGGLVLASSLVYYCKDIGFGTNYTGFLFTLSVIFFTVSGLFRSRTLWLGGILALMGFYGAYAYTIQNADNLFLGMNYPMRFTIFGILVIGLGFIQHYLPQLKFSHRQTYVIGLLIFFTGLWGVSVFGNYGHYNDWQQVRQVQVIGYGIVLAVVAIGALILGIRYRDDITRDFGIIFILLNLYSRYFEFFWNTTNKGLFFLVLAVSFALIGWQLEKKLKKGRQVQP